jgi:hypothetical protein
MDSAGKDNGRSCPGVVLVIGTEEIVEAFCFC